MNDKEPVIQQEEEITENKHILTAGPSNLCKYHCTANPTTQKKLGNPRLGASIGAPSPEDAKLHPMWREELDSFVTVSIWKKLHKQLTAQQNQIDKIG